VYREFRSPNRLRDDIVCFWQSHSGPAPSESRIIPDSCVDIIWTTERPPFIAGPMTTAMRQTVGANAEYTAIRIRPGVAHRLLGVSAKDLCNQHIPLADVWPGMLVRQWEDAATPATLPTRLAAISAVLEARLARCKGPDPLLEHVVNGIARQPFGRIADIPRLSEFSERQLRRRFDEAIGYGPKMLQRILRLQYLLWLASQDRSQRPQLVRLALAAGYTDQPHMTRDVQALTGQTPLQLLHARAPKSAIADVFQPPPTAARTLHFRGGDRIPA
jgi:AraC-like DNA-binding protein